MSNQKWIPVKSICDEMGLSRSFQRKKVKVDPRFTPEVVKVRAKDGRFYQTLCIPEDQADILRNTIRRDRLFPIRGWDLINTAVIWDGKSDFVKIEKSRDAIKQLREHQAAHKTLQIIYLIEGDKEQFFDDNYGQYRIDDKTKHYWLVPQIKEAWEEFEDVIDRFFE